MKFLENKSSSDILQLCLGTIIELSADMDVDEDFQGLDSFQEHTCHPYIFLDKEVARVGFPSSLSPPSMIEARLHLGRTAAL